MQSIVVNLRKSLVKNAINFEKKFHIIPSISSAISELDAMAIVGMSGDEIVKYAPKQKSRQKDFDFEYNGKKYQVKVDRQSITELSSVEKGLNRHNSQVSIGGKWDSIMWLQYNSDYRLLLAYEFAEKNLAKKSIKYSGRKRSFKWIHDNKKKIRPKDIKEAWDKTPRASIPNYLRKK